jgi:hypothetical protein
MPFVDQEETSQLTKRLSRFRSYQLNPNRRSCLILVVW